VLCWLRREAPDPRRRDQEVAEVAGHLIEIAVGRARARRALEHAARHHDLTRLPNRRVVLERIDAVRERSRGGHGTAAVLCIDIDRFKVVNDSLGHGAGDRLLARVAGRLRQLVSGDDLVGHFAADEFVIVLAPPSSLERARDLAGRIELALAEPFVLPEGEVYLSASVGIATTESSRDSAEELFQHADAALARAKKLGRSRVEVFDGVLRDEALGQLRLERDLRLAVDRGELAVHYQLEWDVATGRPVGAEALLRWHHPERGMVLPAEFVDLAEETGLIRRMGRWVLEESVRQARRWVDAVPDLGPFFISVNLSARQLASDDLVDGVRRILEQHDWPADRLMLELTESVLIDERDLAFEVLGELKALGVVLALDDFGTGFSSLNYLHRFPVDVVKIDRSFIGDLDVDGKGSPVVTAVLQVARALGITTCAEGVERVAQLEGLRRLGCTWAQGFALGEPEDADDVLLRLALG
jgi:diguanylate cyclase (GGDEF)-like protein